MHSQHSTAAIAVKRVGASPLAAPDPNQRVSLPAGDGYDWARGPAHVEAAVLGHLMARADDEAGEVVDHLRDEAFSHQHLREIYHAIRTMRADGLPFGPTEVTDRMRAQRTLTNADPVYLVELAAGAVAPSILSSLVKKLRANAFRQLMRDLAKALIDATNGPRLDVNGLAALLRRIADHVDDDKPDGALHLLRIYGGARRAR